MKNSKFSEVQIIKILSEQNQGNTIELDLVDYLNLENNYSELSKLKLKEENKEFEGSILVCNDISDESYKEILNSIYFRYNKLGFEKLNEDKVKHLTNIILNTTKSNYDLLRKEFPNNHITLIEKDFSNFYDSIDDFETDSDDVLLILKSPKINDNNKFNYILKIEESIIVSSKEISKKVGEIILKKSDVIELEIDTLKSIVINQNSKENKIKFVNLYLSSLQNSDIVELLNSISDYNKLFEKGKYPTYIKTDYNQFLLRSLKSKELIKDYYDDKRNDSNFRVTTNK